MKKAEDREVSQPDVDALGTLYRDEELSAERRINLVTLSFTLFYIVFEFILHWIVSEPITNPNTLSNLFGTGFLFLYSIFIFILLRKNIYHPLIKYITLFLIVTIITVIVFGYSYGVDFVHATRSVSLISYFLPIILSGLYQNPRLPLFTTALVCTEYTSLFLTARISGTPIFFRIETFRENILTWDILAVYIIVFCSAGLLTYLVTLRHRKLSLLLQDSSEKLLRESEERKQSEEKARFLENYDILTLLPNLKHFRERLSGEIKKAESRKQLFAVMCLGIDSFRNINQIHGTDTGHVVLRETGKRLTGAYRDDDFVARFMGDRFLVLFTDLHSDYNITDLIKKTRHSFDTPMIVGNNNIKLTAGGGLCTYPHDGGSVETLIEKAETAMYNAKRSGKAAFRLYDSTMQRIMDEQIHIENELTDAVSRGEFTLVYQPKMDRSGKIAGLEALLRWSTPSRGPVGPDVFIPIAEKSGLISTIGYHVFELCCRQIEAWKRAGVEPVRTTVNVSPVQFAQKNFVQSVKSLVSSYSISGDWLGIEVTETGIIEDGTECTEKLHELKRMGLTISIDDFGKGYSSLTRLGRLPLDVLKIDKSFIDELPGSTASVCIVRSIIDLAHNLGFSVVAEGVETVEQSRFLNENGCDMYQGYLYFKPLPAEEITTLIRNEETIIPLQTP